ncbi:transcriptional regulator [Sphaerisporangium melleum]|uniref:Transcriptional regulator n=1 Tax=Sphaerisporangium melleum TaxID=321316 RepID=A0A917RR37_9ACTN|nr:helix-turn-helix transcriptional regulator [Sphaerisporangium melleum]GGL20532.1 transcriptional regulator [Sphaerisporangium melleum]GII73063.1 transcriptional regulator [Sphaerisporangium melleum]
MVQQPIRFGEELRRRRLAAGLTLTDLARRLHYSKGQLSKIERGGRAPSRQLAGLCDNELNAGGALIALARQPVSEARTAHAANSEEEVWLMQLSPDGGSRFQAVSRRQVMAAGASSIAAMSIGRPGTGGVDDMNLLGVSRSLFDQYRSLGQTADPGLLLPALIAQTHTLQELSARAGSTTRRDVLVLASRYAEYVGWLVQEAGDDQAALWWTRRAVELAAAGGDHDLAAYGLVRHALVTLYQNDAGQTVELARRAQRGNVLPRIHGLAAQREAQGHALAGDHDACMRGLERARTLLDRHTPEPGTPVIGTANLPDPAEMIRGWCLYDLGRPRAAAEVFDVQLARVPPGAIRTRVRYGIRRALAYAVAGEVDHACRLAGELLDGVVAVGSTTIAADLRALARTLSRHPGNASVRDLIPRLDTAIHTVTP